MTKLNSTVPGYPHLEESHWFGEGALPAPGWRGFWDHSASQESTAQAVPFAGTGPMVAL